MAHIASACRLFGRTFDSTMGSADQVVRLVQGILGVPRGSRPMRCGRLTHNDVSRVISVLSACSMWEKKGLHVRARLPRYHRNRIGTANFPASDIAAWASCAFAKRGRPSMMSSFLCLWEGRIVGSLGCRKGRSDGMILLHTISGRRTKDRDPLPSMGWNSLNLVPNSAKLTFDDVVRRAHGVSADKMLH